MSEGGNRNSGARPVDEAELHAYVDGRLDAARRAEIAAWLEARPEQAARIADWASDGDSLRQFYNPILDEPIPAGIMPARRLVAGRPLWPRRLAAAVLLLALGAGGGWIGRGMVGQEQARDTSTALVHSATIAHRVFVVEVRHPVEVGANEQSHLNAWLGKRLGSTLAAPNLASQGFQLIGGRLVTSDAGPAALLMYQADDGKRITMYIAAAGTKGRTDLAYAGDDGVGTLYWKDGDLAWALSGEIERDKLMRLAHLAYGQLRP